MAAEDESTTAPWGEGRIGPDGIVLFLFSPARVASFAVPVPGKMRIGRSREAEVSVGHASVSRWHACLHTEAGGCARPQLWIEDLGSANGTRLEGRRLMPNERVRVDLGQPIQLGLECLITVHDKKDTRAPGPLTAVQAAPPGDSPILPDHRINVVRIECAERPEAVETVRELVGTADIVAMTSAGDVEVLLVDSPREAGHRRAEDLRQELERRGVPAKVGLSASASRREASSASDRGDPTFTDPQLSPGVVIASPRMLELYALARRIAASEISVLIVGETGAGKELVARYLHDHSPRANRPFVALNCGAIAASLLEAELFGHVKGAFTGAFAAKPGLLEVAEGGTVFLDELGEMPLDMQVKLLRVLEERRTWRIGSIEPKDINIRIVCATNCDLAQRVQNETFRKDLYYRLNAMTLGVPPLRERREEIAPLARAFLGRAAESAGLARAPELSPAVLAALVAHDWPGNVRELKNVIECALVLSGGGEIRPDYLPANRSPLKAPLIPTGAPGQEAHPLPKVRSSSDTWFDLRSPDRLAGSDAAPPSGDDDVEKRRVLEALTTCGGNQTRAAQLLGISRKTLQARLDQYNIKRPRKGRPRSQIEPKGQ